MNNKVPITRLSKFFSQDDFDINIQMGQEYLHGDLNMKLVLREFIRVGSWGCLTDNGIYFYRNFFLFIGIYPDSGLDRKGMV